MVYCVVKYPSSVSHVDVHGVVDTVYAQSTGHTAVAQLSVFVSAGQASPPFSGATTTVRVREREPVVPQAPWQGPHADHAETTQSTSSASSSLSLLSPTFALPQSCTPHKHHGQSETTGNAEAMPTGEK